MSTAIYDDVVTLIGLSSEERERIKEDLTIPNPEHANVLKFSKYAYTTVPTHLYYFNENINGLSVPIGYDLSPYNIDEWIDYRILPVSEFPEFKMTLRDSQEEAAKAYLEGIKDVKPKGCIQMPTGKGKSVLGLYLAQQLNTRTLIVVHKNDLVVGWQKDIKLAFEGKVKPGLIKAKSRLLGEHITIATIQTLNRLHGEQLEELYSYFGLVIQDEMHHCPSSSFSLVNNFRARYRIGLTATPERADGLAHVMNLYFGDFCYQFKATAHDEDILSAEVRIRYPDVYYQPVCSPRPQGGYSLLKDLYPQEVELPPNVFRVGELPHSQRPRIPFLTVDDIMVRESAPSVCKDIIEEFSLGRSCLVFLTQKEHCRLYREELIKNGVPESSIGLYYGDTKDNQAVLDCAEQQRQFITISTYAKATEGTNVKQWEVVFLVSSINNGKNVEQAVGRIRRRYKEGNKIDPTLVYDYRTPNVYMLSSHGATRDRRYARLHFTKEGDRKPTVRGMFTRGYS